MRSRGVDIKQFALGCIREGGVVVLYAFIIGIILLFISWPSMLHGQVVERGDYGVFYEVASQTSYKITLQVPSTGRSATVTNFQVQCISATATDTCDVEFQRGGTDATATALTVNKLNSKAKPATLTAFRASDVGAGTTISKTQQPANAPIRYLSGHVLSGAGDKVTIIVTSTASLTYRVFADWDEN